jgi:hypothetical protein
MSVSETKQNIEKLKKSYTDPDDKDVLQGWEARISKIMLRNGYLELDQTKETIAYLRKRLRDIKIKLSSDETLEAVDIRAWHRVAKEIKELLALFLVEPERELRIIDEEIARALDE